MPFMLGTTPESAIPSEHLLPPRQTTVGFHEMLDVGCSNYGASRVERLGSELVVVNPQDLRSAIQRRNSGNAPVVFRTEKPAACAVWGDGRHYFGSE